MERRSLTVPQSLYNGAVVLWIMPYVTLRAGRIISAFENIVPRAQWGNAENTFVLLEGAIADAEFAEAENTPDLHLRAQAWQVWWTNRTDSLEQNWNTFVDVANSAFLADGIEALNGARQGFAASSDMQKPPDKTDPNAKGGTSRRKPSSSKK